MRRALPLLAAASLVALAACNKPADRSGPDSRDKPTVEASSPAGTPAADTADAAADRASEASAAVEAQPSPAPRSRADATPSPHRPPASPPDLLQPPALALAYRYALILPADQVRPLMESHQEACERAGPMQCQVLGADARSEGKDEASARLELRATPAWMRSFRTRAEADAKDVGGKVQGSGTMGEDLSRPIVDAEAAQRARAAERDRLQELMQRRTRDLDDTLAIEQEITRVQGEMDQAASDISAMKGRIAMQTLTVDYQSEGLLAPEGASAPIAEASKDFVSTMAWVFAALIRIAAVLTPFAIIGGPIVWFFRNRSRSRPAPLPVKAD